MGFGDKVVFPSDERSEDPRVSFNAGLLRSSRQARGKQNGVSLGRAKRRSEGLRTHETLGSSPRETKEPEGNKRARGKQLTPHQLIVTKISQSAKNTQM